MSRRILTDFGRAVLKHILTVLALGALLAGLWLVPMLAGEVLTEPTYAREATR